MHLNYIEARTRVSWYMTASSWWQSLPFFFSLTSLLLPTRSTLVLAFSLSFSFSFLLFPFTTVHWSNMKSVRAQLSVFEDAWISPCFSTWKMLSLRILVLYPTRFHNMQTEHPSLTGIQQQHRKRSFSSGNFRKRDRTDLICVVCHAPAIGKMTPSRWPTSSGASLSPSSRLQFRPNHLWELQSILSTQRLE